MTTYTEVAAAVIERGDGAILLAQRPAGKPYPGYWEFPGGKIEPGEDSRAALVRELEEELGIRATACTPWITRTYRYTHAHVRLHFHRVGAWEGEPRPLEDQAIAWQRVGALDVSPMLPANAPVLAALALPPLLLVSDTACHGIDRWVHEFEALVARERALVQVREKSLPPLRVQHFLSRILARSEPLGLPVVVNSDCGRMPQCQGVHLTSAALAAAAVRPEAALVGASVHDEAQIERACALGLDYLVLGPVRETRSHPGAATLGWDRFAQLARGRPMPVYAIGGLARKDLAVARIHGAHGIALRDAAFEP